MQEQQKIVKDNLVKENITPTINQSQGQYIGSLVNGKKQGQGLEFYTNGKIMFEGNWNDGLIEGQGIFYDLEGNKYIGYYKNGNKEGYFEEKYQNGKIKCIGNYTSNIRTGKWVGYYENGEQKYEAIYKDIQDELRVTIKDQTICDFDNGELHGPYKEWHQYNILKSEGQYFNNQKTGIWNEYYWNGNLKSQIQYNNNLREGMGIESGNGKLTIVQNLQNIEYQGTFYGEMKHGKGYEKYSFTQNINWTQHMEGQKDGSLLFDKIECSYLLLFQQKQSFEGDFSENKKIYGSLTLGQFIYIGEFENDEINGKGFLLNASTKNKIYEGEFKQSTFNGEGVQYLADGCIQKGIFKGGRLINGDKYNSNGEIIETIYCFKIDLINKTYYGQIKQKQMEGQGMIIDEKTQKIIYQGEFQDNQYHGYGMLYFDNGDYQVGKFLQNVFTTGIIYNQSGYFKQWKQEGTYFYSCMLIKQSIQQRYFLMIDKSLIIDPQTNKKFFERISIDQVRIFIGDQNCIEGQIDLNLNQERYTFNLSYQNICWISSGKIIKQFQRGYIEYFKSRLFISNDQNYGFIYDLDKSEILISQKLGDYQQIWYDNDGNFALIYDLQGHPKISKSSFVRISFEQGTLYKIDGQIEHYFNTNISQKLDLKDRIYYGSIINKQINNKQGALFCKKSGKKLNIRQFQYILGDQQCKCSIW